MGRERVSNNDLYCRKCRSHHHPVECPKAIDENVLQRKTPNTPARQSPQKVEAMLHLSGRGYPGQGDRIKCHSDREAERTVASTGRLQTADGLKQVVPVSYGGDG